MRGTVLAFDAHVGLGEISLTDGSVVMFHCAEIVDGTRSIALGAAVECEVKFKFGRAEASAIRPT